MRATLQTVVIVVGIVTSVFTLGYNWRRVDEIAASNSSLATRLDNGTYVRTDVNTAQFANVDRQLAEIKQLLQNAQAPPSRPSGSLDGTRTFDK